MPGGLQSTGSQRFTYDLVTEQQMHIDIHMYAQTWMNRTIYNMYVGFPSGSGVKNSPAMQEIQEIQVQSLGWEDSLEEEMATHFSILAWKIPWTEEPGRLQSMESQRVGYN